MPQSDRARANSALLIVPAIVAISWVWGEVVLHGPILCPLRLLTGLPCAGCGMTRAFVALVHGQWDAALGFNLLSPLVFASLLAWWLGALVAATRQQEVPSAPKWLVRLAFLTVAGYWLGRTVYFVSQPHLLERLAADSPIVRWLTLPGIATGH